MKVERIPVQAIAVPDGHREINPAAVDNLVASMGRSDVGLLNPILVRVFTGSNEMRLVAGRHRLEAAKRLGWDFINAFYLNVGDAEARMRTIAENLHRSELTALERSEQIEEWRVLCEQNPNAQVGHSGGKPQRGVSQTAKDLGVSRQEVERAEKIAKITPAAKEAAKEAGIDDNQSKLLKVAAAEPEKQVEAVKQAAKRSARKTAEQPDTPVDDPTASAEARKATFAALDTEAPVAAETETDTDTDTVTEAPVAAETETDVESEIDPGNIRSAFLLRADQALTFAVYSGPVDKEIAEAARATAVAWAKLSGEMLSTISREPEAPTDSVGNGGASEGPTLGDAVADAFSELEDLASECRQVVDNASASEGLSQTSRTQTLDDTANTLESLISPDVAAELAEIGVTPPKHRKLRSRRDRRDAALATIAACMDALDAVDDQGARDLRVELEDASSQAEMCEFPGMYG